MTIKRVFSLLVGAVLFSMGIRPTLDPDMWWHLRTGEAILAAGIPRQDPFSLTRLGQEWVTHEWLTEALMWLVYSGGGLPGLALVFAFLSALAFWLVYRVAPGQPYLAGTVTLFAAIAAGPSFGVRPQVVNMLFLALFIAVVERVRQGKLAPVRLFLLPVATIAWVNLHSGYLLGVVVLATYAAGELAERWLPSSERLPGAGVGRLVLCAGLCFVAALANPNGWEMWTYPFSTLGSQLMQQNIVEWGSPNFHMPMYQPFAVLLLLGALAWAMAGRRPAWTDLLLFLGTAAAGLLSRRHIPLFALVATPVVARALVACLASTRIYVLLHGEDAPFGRGKAILNSIVVVVALVGLLGAHLPKLVSNDAEVARAYPAAAVDYIKRNGLAERRMYNSYAWGGYLIWHGLKPFVDGRADIYGDFLGYYLKTLQLQEDWRQPLEEHAVDYVLIERNSRLATLLQASSAWKITYEDELARIFTRDPSRPEKGMAARRRMGRALTFPRRSEETTVR